MIIGEHSLLNQFMYSYSEVEDERSLASSDVELFYEMADLADIRFNFFEGMDYSEREE